MNESGRDHVELARAGFEAFNRGDIDAVLEMLAPDVEVALRGRGGGGGHLSRPDGYLDWNRIWSTPGTSSTSS